MPPIAKSSAANSTRRDYTTSCDVDDSLCENFPLITRPHRSIKRRREMCQASNCRPPKNRFPKNGKSSPAFRFVREGTPQRLNNNKNSYTSRTVRDCHVLDDGPTKKKRASQSKRRRRLAWQLKGHRVRVNASGRNKRFYSIRNEWKERILWRTDVHTLTTLFFPLGISHLPYLYRRLSNPEFFFLQNSVISTSRQTPTSVAAGVTNAHRRRRNWKKSVDYTAE